MGHKIPQFIIGYIAIMVVVNNDQQRRQEKVLWSTEFKSHLSTIIKNRFYFILVGFINLEVGSSRDPYRPYDMVHMVWSI